MITRIFGTAVLVISVSTFGAAQASQDAKFKIQGTVMAEQAAARIPMPFGADGFEMTDQGEIDQQKVQQAIKKNGQAVEPGRIVTITGIAFSDNKIEIELDGGGKNKKAWYDRIEVGMGSGGRSVPVSKDNTAQAKGSKITLKFAKKVPENITPALLHELLGPALDFEKHNFLKTGIESLPPEYQEAVKLKEARIGMDKSTVITAMGRADKRSREKNAEGIYQDTWIYYGRGKKATFVWFQDDVVIKIEAF